jgi:hypothetical protein
MQADHIEKFTKAIRRRRSLLVDLSKCNLPEEARLAGIGRADDWRHKRLLAPSLTMVRDGTRHVAVGDQSAASMRSINENLMPWLPS